MKKDILVIGDSCRDVYVYCDTNRLAPDVPVPVLNVLYQNENGGMASNVFRNIQPKVSGVKLITNQNWYSITKTRYVHKGTNHTFFRVDSNQDIKRIDVKSIDLNYKIIVVSDYDKGFLTENDIHLISGRHPLTFIDTKKPINLQTFSDYTYIKMNEFEWELCEKKGAKYDDWADKLIITMSERGCLYQNEVFPVNRDIEVRDLSGAGDTFMASLVYKFVESKDLRESIKFANECATKVVQKRGVTTI